MRKYRALFIDDRDTDSFLNSLMIKEDDIPVNPVFVNSGHDALSFLKDCLPEDFPELIFIDINMPLMDGFQFVDTYNQHYGVDRQARLYFLTSSIRDSEKERALQLDNVEGFFNKPLRKRMFDQILPKLVD